MAALDPRKEQKKNIIAKFRRGTTDTGSSEVQVALITARINQLTEHFKTHKKDHHGQRGLVKLVNQRRKLLDYLKGESFKSYETLIKNLDIRK